MQDRTAPGLRERVGRLERLLAEVEERFRQDQMRVSGYLHDEPLQSLASAVVRIGLIRMRDDPERAADDLARAESLVREGLEKVRDLCYELRRQGTLDEDLPTGIRALAERLHRTLEVEIALDMESVRRPVDPDLPAPLVDALRALVVEVKVQGGSRARLRYADGPDDEIVIEIGAPELGIDGDGAAELESLLERLRLSLRSFDVRVDRDEESDAFRFVVPGALVEDLDG